MSYPIEKTPSIFPTYYISPSFIKTKILHLYQRISSAVNSIFEYLNNLFTKNEINSTKILSTENNHSININEPKNTLNDNPQEKPAKPSDEINKKHLISNNIEDDKTLKYEKTINDKKFIVIPHERKIIMNGEEGFYTGDLDENISGKEVTIKWNSTREDKGTFEDGLLVEGTSINGQCISVGKFDKGKLIEGSYDSPTYKSEGTYLNGLLDGSGTEYFKNEKLTLYGFFNEGVLVKGYIDDEVKKIFIDPEIKEDLIQSKEYESYKTYESYIKSRPNQPYKLELSNGTVEEGEINNGERIIKKITKADGSYYEGTFKNDCLDGKYVSEKFTCDGHFKIKTYNENNKKEYSFVSGTRTLNKTGEIQIGTFKNDYLEGPGEVKFSNGHIYKCDFKDGQPIGKGTVKVNFGPLNVKFTHPHDDDDKGVLVKTLHVQTNCYKII
ncbi:MAG: hypothetical protein Q8K60_02245 [Parachlamydiaceae bacterium]|nr:hypothetical protein [Parachlamydiaceae bacterium]